MRADRVTPTRASTDRWSRSQMDARTRQVHGSARLKCHETEKQTLPSWMGRRGALDGLAELSVTDPG